MAKNGTVLFAASTDVTGNELATALDFTGSKTWNGKKTDVIISWGWSGAKAAVDIADLKSKTKLVINNPTNVHENSDKAKAFAKMSKAGVLVPKYFSSETIKNAVQTGKVSFPIVGRMKKHSGGKKFYLCLEQKALDHAISKGASLFTEYLPKDTEYRIHVMNGAVLQACEKEPQGNPTSGWKALKTELITAKAEKDGTTLDANTMSFVLDHIVGRDFEVPNFAVRSNKLGWKFSFIDNCPTAVSSAAINAVKAVGLDFGAVDLIRTDSGKIVVLEVNSGPGLCSKMLAKYKAGFESLINKKLAPATSSWGSSTATATPAKTVSVVSATGVKAPGNKAAKLAGALSGLSAEQTAAILALAAKANSTELAGLHKLMGVDD